MLSLIVWQARTKQNENLSEGNISRQAVLKGEVNANHSTDDGPSASALFS